MKIRRARIFLYELPLAKPLTTKEKTEKTRVGLVLELQNDDEHLVYSEIAPLPGLHMENWSQALKQLQEFVPTLLGCSLSENDAWDLSTSSVFLFPSVVMGVDLGLLQLVAWQKKEPLYRYLNTNAAGLIRLRALIDPLHEKDCVKAAVGVVSQGFQTIKLKIGRMSYQEEVEVVKNVRHSVGPGVEICLDANRAFDLDDAIRLGQALRGQNIAYIEEPVFESKDLLRFYQATGIPIALDETWLQMPLEPFLGIKEALFALVIKPSLVGGMKRFFGSLFWMKNHGIKPLLTSTFESGLGLLLWAQLVAVMEENEVAHGLGTFSWLKEDLLSPPFRDFRGQIDVVQMEKELAAFRLEPGDHCRLVFTSEVG